MEYVMQNKTSKQILIEMSKYCDAIEVGNPFNTSTSDSSIIMDANKTILIFVLILIMCMGSAGIAMRKLVDADPAEIF